MEWQPIETAPRDGSRVLVAWAGGSFDILVWKTNQRIVSGHSRGDDSARELSESYFGDPDESDDYELAKEERAPTHWMPLPAPPPSERTGA